MREKSKAGKHLLLADEMGLDFFRMKEKRLDLNLWLVDGKNQGGSHFMSHFASSPATGAVVEKQGRAGDTKSANLGVVAELAATPRDNVLKS